MLGTRIIAGFLMIAITVVILTVDQWLEPWFPFWFLFATLATGLATRELVNLLGSSGVLTSYNTRAAVFVVVASNWVPHVVEHLIHDEKYNLLGMTPNEPLSAFAWTFMTFIGVIMGCFVYQSYRFDRPGGTIATISGTIFVVAYIGLLGSFMIQMRWMSGRGGGLLPLAYLISCAKGADTGAYLTGRLIGRHKLCPWLSPNKTIEGALGGLALSVGISLLISWIAQKHLELPGLDPWTAVFYGLVIGVVGQLGDLVESMIKRDCEQKDASSAVPGFGGVLDVLDSLIFAGPVAYLFWLWVGP